MTRRLTDRDDHPSPLRAQLIAGWVRDAARQFVDAPVQTYVPLLVEHIVRDRMARGPACGPRSPT